MANPASIVFSSYGVTAEVVVEDPARLEEVRERLPPDWEPVAAAASQSTFTLTTGGEVLANGEPVVPEDGREALDALESAVCAEIAVRARDHVFVHAGVVAIEGRAIVIPGASMAGKSTLVAALMRAGAEYYSDEYAVLDMAGRVHPYARRLGLRSWPEMEQQQVTADELGVVVGSGAADVAVIAAVRYSIGSAWRPAIATSADGALALLSHAIPVRERPAQAVAAARLAAVGATVLEGKRGEADEAAAALLGALEGRDGLA